MSDNDSLEQQRQTVSGSGMYDPLWGQETWRVALRLNHSRLKESSVLWAQFNEDPVQQFKLDLEKNHGLLHDCLAQIDDDEERTQKRSMLIATLWNNLFRRITGEKVEQLTQGQETARILISNEPRDTIWIATKVAISSGNNICWASLVKTEPGSTVELRLTAENVLDLEQIYREVIGDD
jgi:hypothetical protein